MASPLQSLLDLRRDAEHRSAILLDRASAVRAAEEVEQRRLVAGWGQALAALDGEPERPTTAGATAARAMTHDRYRAELAAEVARAARLADAHRRGALAAASQAEATARTALEQAHAEVEAVERLLAREAAEAARLALRRAEDSAFDLVNAAIVRERGR